MKRQTSAESKFIFSIVSAFFISQNTQENAAVETILRWMWKIRSFSLLYLVLHLFCRIATLTIPLNSVRYLIFVQFATSYSSENEIIVKKVTVTLAKRVQIWFITKMAYLVCNCLDFFYFLSVMLKEPMRRNNWLCFHSKKMGYQRLSFPVLVGVDYADTQISNFAIEYLCETVLA